MNSVLVTGNMTVKSNIILDNACPTIQSTITSSEAVSALGVVSFPDDDTIPQNTEGAEVITCSITPQRADSVLQIEYDGTLNSSTVGTFVICLFRDSTANALKTVMQPTNNSGSTNPMQCNLKFWVSADSTSSTTFKIRAGKRAADGGTVNVNANLYGGVLTSFLRVTELMDVNSGYGV